MTDRQHRISIKRFLAIGPYEEEPGFKTMLTELSQRGMFIAGLLGAIVVIIYVGAYISIGKTIVWSYSGIDPGTEFVLFDKCIVIVLCLGSIFCSRFSFSLFNARLLIFFLVWVASLAMLLDDIAHRDLSVGPAYISLALILAVGTIPYKGWHTAVISFIVIVTSILAVHWVPIFLGWNAIELLSEQMIYLSLVAILLTGMSSQLYLNRYDQFRARHRAQQLSKQLEERADTLEKMKRKSDRQAQKILEHEKLKDRFFANISHEFRTPLTLILGPLKDMIGDHKDQQKRKVSISTFRLMYNNSKQLLEMINQLLDLSKVDAGRITLNRQQVDLQKLVAQTVHSFSPMAESQKVKLRCKIV
ncbi:MAG TPA: HAMP domain-containing sensor histidine kinase, partial [Balneolaceae bacterium]|nr:HAMP domain-containing sensor histidine kinase [Balneolaceae bacterium]